MSFFSSFLPLFPNPQQQQQQQEQQQQEEEQQEQEQQEEQEEEQEQQEQQQEQEEQEYFPMEGVTEHLFDIANEYGDRVPHLSAHYMSAFQSRLLQVGNDLSSTFLATHCRYCQAVFVAGVTCTVRITRITSSKHPRKAKEEEEEEVEENGWKVRESESKRIRVISASDIKVNPAKRSRGCRRNVVVRGFIHPCPLVLLSPTPPIFSL